MANRLSVILIHPSFTLFLSFDPSSSYDSGANYWEFAQSLALSEIEAIVAEIEKEKEQGQFSHKRCFWVYSPIRDWLMIWFLLFRRRTETWKTRCYSGLSGAHGSGVGQWWGCCKSRCKRHGDSRYIIGFLYTVRYVGKTRITSFLIPRTGNACFRDSAPNHIGCGTGLGLVRVSNVRLS